MEYVRAELASKMDMSSPVSAMIHTPAGFLVIALREWEFAIEMLSPKYTLLYITKLLAPPKCLVCKEQWMFCALSKGNILVLSAEDGSILHTIEKAHRMGMFGRDAMTLNSLALWGTYLISGGYFDGMVRWWHLGSWEAAQEQESRVGYTYSLAVSPSGVLAVGGDKDIALFDAQSSQPKEGLLEGHSNSVLCLVWQDERHLVSGSADTDIRLWDVDSGTCLAILEGHDGFIFDLSLRGPILASASGDETVRLWSLHTYQCLQVLELHQSSVLCVMFSGRTLLSGGNDDQLLTWKGGYIGMSKQSIRMLLFCHKHGDCPLSIVSMGIIKIIVQMVDESLMWGE